MLDNLIFSVNAVLPIFVVALTGYILKNIGFLTDGFISVADKLVFKVLLPCLLFTKVAYIHSGTVGQNELTLLAFCLAGALLLCFVLCVTVPIFVKDNGKVGSFVQGVFRSNVAFLGIPFAISLFGDEGGALTAVVLAAIVPLFNVLAVTVLCIFNPKKEGVVSPGKRIVSIIKGIVTNPLIDAIIIALPFGIFGLGGTLPSAVTKTVTYFADASTPLAILLVGASFTFEAFKGRAGLAICASVMKTALSPALFMTIGYLVFGFTGVHLGIVMIVFGTPTAISSYIMAKNMNADAHLANQIVLLTTLMSMFTIFAFTVIMKSFGLF